MPDTITFNESVFSSYNNLQNFFLRSNAVNEVLNKKDKPYSKIEKPLNSNLRGKWLVCQIASAPFRLLLGLALKIISKSASLVGAKEFAKQTKTAFQYQKAGFGLYSDTPTKLFMIKDTTNRPNDQGAIVNKTPFIPESRITDPKVKHRTFCRLRKGIKFNHDQGICRGMSNWFLYLYLNTKNQFADPRSHMAALGAQFSKGGGIEPTLLQSINLWKGKLLNLKIGTQGIHSHGSFGDPLYAHTPAEWKSQSKQIIEKLQNMPAGAYGTYLPFHMTAYIKINDRQGFFFDPNEGIIEIIGDNVGEKLYEMLTETLKHTGENSETYPDLDYRVGIIPYQKRS